MADRYASIPRALQYSIVHLFGDFPESDYSLSSKCVHFFGIMVGIAIISSFAGVFIAGFNDYLRDERQEELAELRLRRAIVVMRSTKAIQRRFRASKAIRDEEATQGQMPQPRPRPQASFWKKVALECTFGKLSVLFNCLLCFNLLCTLFSSLPEWNRHGGGRVGSALLWLEMGCTIAFTFECMMHFIATPRFSYWRIIEIICILPGMFEIAYSAQQSLGVQGERNGYLDDVFEALLVVRVVRILNFSVIRREVTMILRTLEEAAPQLAIPGYLALNVWVTSSALFMWLENYYKEEGGEAENMTSVPATMYWCCIYLTGEWANVDFTYAGSRLCILYVVFGIALFSIPVGIIVGAMETAVQALELEKADMEEQVHQTTLQLHGQPNPTPSRAAAAAAAPVAA